MVRYQWGIFWADLNPTKGSEQSGVRPVLVISSEEVNEALPVVTIMTITSLKPGRRIYPIEVFLPTHVTGLTKDSIVMAHQIRSISKERIGEQCGYIESNDMRNEIRNTLKVYLDIQ